MKKLGKIGFIYACLACLSCIASAQDVSFATDVAIIKQHHQPIILSQGDAKIVVLAEYQGRIMTSTANGFDGLSLGWINRDYLSVGDLTKKAAIGGADRLWFGPETGDYSLFFKPGADRIPENIVVPAAFSIDPFDIETKSDNKVVFRKKIMLENYSQFVFKLDVQRTVTLFSNADIQQYLGITYKKINAVGFGASTRITNIGDVDWQKKTGLLSIWDLGAFLPSDKNTTIIPTKNNLAKVTSYFTETKSSHTKIIGNKVYYKSDADYLNKIGIPPQHTLPIMGSYDEERNLLTVVTFQFNDLPDDTYVNSVWYPDNYQPYLGDVINVFNDGKIGEEGPFGPFYELESSSNAKALKIGESQHHFHNTYHFQGDKKELNSITQRLFGVSLHEITQVFL